MLGWESVLVVSTYIFYHGTLTVIKIHLKRFALLFFESRVIIHNTDNYYIVPKKKKKNISKWVH